MIAMIKWNSLHIKFNDQQDGFFSFEKDEYINSTIKAKL